MDELKVGWDGKKAKPGDAYTTWTLQVEGDKTVIARVHHTYVSWFTHYPQIQLPEQRTAYEACTIVEELVRQRSAAPVVFTGLYLTPGGVITPLDEMPAEDKRTICEFALAMKDEQLRQAAIDAYRRNQETVGVRGNDYQCFMSEQCGDLMTSNRKLAAEYRARILNRPAL